MHFVSFDKLFVDCLPVGPLMFLLDRPERSFHHIVLPVILRPLYIFPPILYTSPNVYVRVCMEGEGKNKPREQADM